MEYYVGLDVSLKQTSICVVDQSGSVVREGVVDPDAEAISVYVRSKARGAVRIGLETRPTSTCRSLASQFSQQSADSCTSTAATTQNRRAHGRTTNNYARLRTISAPKIRPLDLRHAGELGAGAGELDAAVLQHIGVVGESQRGGGHLLDQDDRCSLLAQRADRA